MDSFHMRTTHTTSLILPYFSYVFSGQHKSHDKSSGLSPSSRYVLKFHFDVVIKHVRCPLLSNVHVSDAGTNRGGTCTYISDKSQIDWELFYVVSGECSHIECDIISRIQAIRRTNANILSWTMTYVQNEPTIWSDLSMWMSIRS